MNRARSPLFRLQIQRQRERRPMKTRRERHYRFTARHFVSALTFATRLRDKEYAL
jgi:hypothetical protein